MTVLATLRKLILGETWALPLALAALLGACTLLHELADGLWGSIGPFVLPGGVVAALTLGVVRSLPPRRR